MTALAMPPQANNFRVVDENCVIYECLGTNVAVDNGRLVVSGIVLSRWEVEEQHRPEAIELMHRETKGE